MATDRVHPSKTGVGSGGYLIADTNLAQRPFRSLMLWRGIINAIDRIFLRTSSASTLAERRYNPLPLQFKILFSLRHETLNPLGIQER